jgi:signal transduction histidine kinase
MYQHNVRSSNDRMIVFVSLCIAITAVIVDTSIVKVYRFITTPLSPNNDIATFIIIAIVYAVVQYILIRSVRTQKESSKNFAQRSIHKIVTIIQYVMIALLVFVILQMIIISAYNIAIVAVAVTISYGLALVMTGLLALRFFSWFRSTRIAVVLSYTFAAAALSINAGFTLAYVVQALQNVPAVVRPHIGHMSGFTTYDAVLNSGYLTTSIVSFLITWIATILLLHHHSKKLGVVKYWILVTIPLVYFLSQFQPIFLDLFSAYRMSNPILFDVLYTIIFNLSKPVGGILFGIAFWIAARNIDHKAVKSYLSISGYGLLLFFASNQATVLINSPYPPFGMAATSIVGLSSYLIFIGIYSSAASVAQDRKLRQLIKKSTIEESKLLISIGSAEMEQEIERRAVNVARKQQDTLTQQTGIPSSLTESDMKQYVSKVLKEILVLQNIDEILSKGKEILETSTEFLVCSKAGGIRLVYNNYFDSYEKIMQEYSKGKHKGIRLVTSIDRDSIDIVQKFLTIGVHIKHVKNMPPIDFAVSDKEMVASIEKTGSGQAIKNLLVSTEQPYIDHFTSIFNELWKSGSDAKDRIKAIEEGIDTEGIEIIQNPAEIQKIIFDLLKSAQEEILVIFSSANAFHRQEYLGATQFLKEAANERGVKTRILTPKDDLIVKTAQRWMEQQSQQKNQEQQSSKQQKISVRFIEPYLQTKVSLLIVDRKFSLAVELKDDAAQKAYEAMGLATYSNSKPTVLSYVSIFDNLWRQNELYQQVKEANEQLESANEKLKVHDKIQQEFINIAAHELKTPIQPILSLSEVVLSRTKDVEQAKLLEVINRNAQRLHRLTEDILDVTRIESQSLHLRKVRFNLIEMINSAIADSRNQIKKEYKDNIKLESVFNGDIFIEADRNRIYQVILNLLNNAIKFTKEGTIVITAVAEEEKNGHNEVIVGVRDTGQGIDSEILPRLFTKFATKSETGGTGLGLFISKSIVEAHGGRIWAKNNSDGEGTTFSFSLPIVNK